MGDRLIVIVAHTGQGRDLKASSADLLLSICEWKIFRDMACSGNVGD